MTALHANSVKLRNVIPLHANSVKLRNVIPVRVNGKQLAVVATNSSYLPQYQREDNRFSVFVTGNNLNSRKSWHATPEAALAAAEAVAKAINNAFYPTLDGSAPWY